MPSYLALNLTCFDIHRLDLFCKKRTLLFCGIVLAMRDKRENADQLISFNVLSQQLINFLCKFLCGESFHLLGYIKN